MPNPEIKSMADLFAEEEDRLMAEAMKPERIAADRAALQKSIAEDIAAGRRDADGNWIIPEGDDADLDDEGDDEPEDEDTEEGEDL